MRTTNWKQKKIKTSNTSNGFTSSQIGNVDEGIVKGGINVSNSKDILASLNELGTESGFLLLDAFLLLSALVESWSVQAHRKTSFLSPFWLKKKERGKAGDNRWRHVKIIYQMIFISDIFRRSWDSARKGFPRIFRGIFPSSSAVRQGCTQHRKEMWGLSLFLFCFPIDSRAFS